MAFRSPLFLLGLGTEVTTQGGYRTPLPTFNAGSATAVVQGGFTTPLPFWNAGTTQAVDNQVKGGKSRRRERERRRLLEALLILNERQENVKILPEEVSSVTKSLLEEGKAEVNGTEIIVGNIPTPPSTTIEASAPSLDSIINPLDREIAELIRTQEQLKFVDQILDFQEDVLKFEEEFLLFLILMME